MIRVVLPFHLRNLAKEGKEVQLEVPKPVTQHSVLNALEAKYPMLRGTIRDHATQERRAFIRFFAEGQDLSHLSPDAPLPESVVDGREPFRIIGAIAGGSGDIMVNAYKPNNYNSISPYLIVDGAQRTIDFLIQTFNAMPLRHITDDKGRIRHAEVHIDDSVNMLADKAEGWPPTPSYVHIYVPDVEATYQRALAAGAESMQEPEKKEDADKRGN